MLKSDYIFTAVLRILLCRNCNWTHYVAEESDSSLLLLQIAKGSLDEELVDMESTTQNVDNSTSDVDNFSDVEKVKYSSVVIYTYYKYIIIWNVVAHEDT